MEDLTKYQRLMLINQYKILAKLEPSQSDEYNDLITALKYGYPIWYEEAFGWQVFDGLTKEQCREVDDILDMFWQLKMTYDRLEDKTGIDERSITYQGFDGNNNHEYMKYADYLINTKQRYDGIVAKNSHSIGTLPMYRRMLEVWNTCEIENRPTKEDMIRITQATIHPTNR